MIESGRFTADHILRDKRAKMGFPTVNEILERAEGRRGVLVPQHWQRSRISSCW
ncbi:hypothetical protein HGG76_10450 [Ochrobactrum tritici]|uniref:Uncharacterized protein n=1 Tax=Brucella tritici TaxID=94626 RepID=A0A7X6FT12_9HYPH|nr:hypothetical protein [Brucella tritici]